MTDRAEWQFTAYHPTAETVALAGELTPPPEPVVVARTHLADAARIDGYVLDLISVREEERTAVVVDEHGNWEPAEGGNFTGHIIRWVGVGERRSDAEPVVDLTPCPDPGGKWTATIPEVVAAHGGGVRFNHDFEEMPVVYAFSGPSGIGYDMAVELDAKTMFVEVQPGTTHLIVEPVS